MRRFAIALAACLAAAPAYAQQLTVRGVVIGPDAKPVPSQIVVLHRVSQGGGATVAQDTASADGRFELSAPATTDSEAVYFVAGRYQDEMYLVPPFRGDEARDQILQVGVPGTSASSLVGSASGAPLPPAVRPATSRSWLLFAIPLFGVAAVALVLLLPKGRIPRERTLLIRIAEIDERVGSVPGPQRDTLLAERSSLIARLRGA